MAATGSMGRTAAPGVDGRNGVDGINGKDGTSVSLEDVEAMVELRFAERMSSSTSAACRKFCNG